MEVGFANGTITLDSDKAVYYRGQFITGNVSFRLGEPVNVSAINIQFLGMAQVIWSEREEHKQHGRSFETTVQYKAEEQYFNVVQCLYGGQGVTQLPPGPHSFPIQFQIPPTVPSSFQGERGQVDYEIRATMEYPIQKRDELVKLFTVVVPTDLNKEDPEIAKPQTLSFEEVFSCSCSPRPLTINVGLPVAGFCPGQVIPVTVNVKNKANRKVKKVILQIVTRTRYHSQQPVAKYTTPEEVLASTKTKLVLSNMERHYSCELQLPAFIAPNLDSCGIMDIGYFFKVVVKLSGCTDDLEDAGEIFMGQIPLANFTDGRYEHPMAHSLPSGPVPEYFPQSEPATTQINPVNAFHTQSVNPQVNMYPGYQHPQANVYPGAVHPPSNQVSAYPGYPQQPLISPTAPVLDAYPPTSSVSNPMYDMGFRAPGYPGQQ
ncbi:arrestin domain-containing protein 2-like isoform X2 [Ostrinia furnacalis]|uniref:arrestin domain-containing protein 2-like isoform X2 n=1 Tax=Ostrinia furnacalis TaxID=93504 RepID=UPI001040226F|nr:arrestin domain-containing protein 2-like isoform X2 [Ostrinia furnacalis]